MWKKFVRYTERIGNGVLVHVISILLQNMFRLNSYAFSFSCPNLNTQTEAVVRLKNGDGCEELRCVILLIT